MAQQYHSGLRLNVRQFLPNQYTKVLEIGCGEGQFVSNLSGNFEYWGIEPDAAAAKYAKSILDKVLIGLYQDVVDQLPENYFDLIICNDVIEHMQDHDWFLDSIRQKMSASAALVGSIPNVRFFTNLIELVVQKDWHYRGSGILDTTHLRFFTEKSIKRMFEDHHYKIEKLEGIAKFTFSRRTLKGIVQFFLLPILGSDTSYLQFGFRVRKNDK